MELRYTTEAESEKLLIQEVFDADITGVIGCKIEGHVVVIYVDRILTPENKTALDLLIANHDPDNYTYPLVMDLVERQYDALPIQKVDFTIHLKPELVLTKSLTKHPNGRPNKATYTYNGVNIAEITWQFYDAPGGLYYLKEQRLAYYNSKNQLMPSFLIKRKQLDFTVPNQLEESIQERIDARKSIVGEIKAVCSGSLQIALGLTLEQVVVMIQPFWNALKTERDNFIELAAHDWANNIAAIDTSQEYTWMNTPVDMNGTTCKQYMLFRLGY